MRLLPLVVTLLCLASLFLFVPPTQVAANSLGFGIPCDVENPILGSDNLQRPGANDAVRAMWWVKKPTRASNRYTLRTADTGNAAGDPTSYVPGQWVDLHLRANEEDRQFNGLLMYAENAAKKKVGEWFIPPRQDFRVDSTSGCVTHKNADRKNYYTNFRVRFPAGTGTVVIRALIKYGLAFPALEGLFLYPNDRDLVLTEAAAQPVTWVQGAVGESCNTACRKQQNVGCDVNAMKAAMANPATFYDTAKKFSNCALPLMRGCSSATPSVGENGCYYHDDTCTRLPVTPVWSRADPCGAPLAAYVPGKVYNAGDCCVYEGFRWCANYYITSTPEDRQYGPWSKSTACMPAGGYPAEATPVVLPPRPAAQIDCASIFSSPLDGNRICACAGAATGGPDPPTQAPPTSPPQNTPAYTTDAPQKTFTPGQKSCNTPHSAHPTTKVITVTSNGLNYQFSHIPNVDNPSLDLVIGRTYSFKLDDSINGGDHPFAIKTQQSIGSNDLVSSMSVTNNNVKTGTITFIPAANSQILYYQCSVHASMTNIISFVEESSCGGTTAAPITTTTPKPTEAAKETIAPTTTTLPPDSCALINCGNKGVCSFGKCKCNSGYTGDLCTNPPAIKCNVNCPNLNRAACPTDDQCGACLPGFKLVGVNCVVECDVAQCNNLNRLTCTTANQCGACSSGFIEPSTTNKNTGLTCVSAAAASPPQADAPAPNPNGYKFSIGAQWQSGFCGTVSGAVTDSRNIEFMLPTDLVMATSWNLGAEYTAATGIVTGTLPEWVKGSASFSGGLCANYAYDPATLIQTNSVGFTRAVRSAQSLASLQSIDQYDVVFTLELKGIASDSIDGDAAFVPALNSEVARLVSLKPSQVSFLRYDRKSATSVVVSFNVHCGSPDQISLAVSFAQNLVDLQSIATVAGKDQRATEYTGLFPKLITADASTVGMTFPTEIYSDNTAAITASSAYRASISASIIAILAAASAWFARW